ncbi:hypothetical protein [Sphingomonas melonis]|uniref:hypothetical protein n=1 Tax=Sphingomonas melonis TaxID=152682 RepID=UPI000A994F0E|nr:hypothetical protein [Sphingomonas melonis]
MYTEIVRLLSAGALDDDAVREKAAEVDAAVTDPKTGCAITIPRRSGSWWSR